MVNGTTTGGAGGTVVTVSNETDFIAHATATGPRVIQVQGVLTIGSVTLKSDKTIVGLGTEATLLGRLRISGINNVIVRNLRITNHGDDGVSIRDPNTHHVWVDHVTFFDCSDGSCDISQGADYVTVSWCKFVYPNQQEHRFTMIADGPKDGGPLTGRITLHHNWWGPGCDQRMAATSDGLIHYYNNYFNCSGNSYCSNARDEAELNIENNYYSGVKNPVTLSVGTGVRGKIRTSGNIYSSCTGTIHPGTDSVFSPPYAYVLDPAATVPAIVTGGAGAPGDDTILIPPKVWEGDGANNSLNTAYNWVSNRVPRVYDTLEFAGSVRLNPNNNFTSGSEFQGVGFRSDAGPFVLGGNSLRLGGAMVNESDAVQTVNLAIDFTYGLDHYSMNREFDVRSPEGSLVINGNIVGFSNDYGKPYVVTKRGAGLLTLNGANSFPGLFSFDGGLVRFSNLGNLGGPTQLRFNGGGLQWAPGNSADISSTPVLLGAGGVTFDVGPNNVAFANPASVFGPARLTKLGSGTLTLNGNNVYPGITLIGDGTLALGPTGALPNTVQIVLSNSAVLDVSGRSDGTLTLDNGQSLTGNGAVAGHVAAANGAVLRPGLSVGRIEMDGVLTLQPGSTTEMELDAVTATNDTVTGLATLNYGGQLVISHVAGMLAAGDRFTLFSADTYNGAFSSIVWPDLSGSLQWTNRLALDGSIAVFSVVDPTPTNIAVTVVEGLLQVEWPLAHLGWRLEAQTNEAGAGLGGLWHEVAGSDATNRMSFPVGLEHGSVFYRLAFP